MIGWHNITNKITNNVMVAVAAASLAAGLSVPRAASSQSLPLKRPTLTPVLVACPVFPTPATPVRQQVDEANRLATLGQESSLEGDHRAARDLISQAVTLDPRNPSLAYRLGREHEELGQRDEAVRQYCRYLSLAPTAGDAPQIADRVAKLLSPADVTRGKAVVDAFRAGVVDFDSHDWSAAVDAFGKALTAEPALAAAAYDGALAHDRDGEKAAAIRDFSRYLQLAPQAEDAGAVRARIASLRSGIPHSGEAFALGLLPGGGQFYTGQPVLGTAVVALAAGGVVLALQTRMVTRDTLYPGPFGGTYPGTYTQTTHPNLAVGIGVAGGITLLGAIEAALVAHGRSEGLSAADTTVGKRVAFLPHVGPVTVEFPTLVRGADGLRWALPVNISIR